MNRNRLRDRLILHEGLRLKPYKDQLGFITIGIGRCLDKKGISKDEALYLLDNDMNECIFNVIKHIEFFDGLPDAQQEVVVEMCFQLGISGLLQFKDFLFQLSRGNFVSAAKEMLDSDWAKQTPNRAKELSQIMDGTITVT